MHDLLDRAIAAHGGLQRWNQIRSVAFDASIDGAFWHVKGRRDALKDVHLEVDTTRQLVTTDLAGHDKRFVFEPHRVAVQHRDGRLIQARENPETSFDGHRFDTPWDDIHLAYFVGEAQTPPSRRPNRPRVWSVTAPRCALDRFASRTAGKALQQRRQAAELTIAEGA